jgi:hypothetical protein
VKIAGLPIEVVGKSSISPSAGQDANGPSDKDPKKYEDEFIIRSE